VPIKPASSWKAKVAAAEYVLGTQDCLQLHAGNPWGQVLSKSCLVPQMELIPFHFGADSIYKRNPFHARTANPNDLSFGINDLVAQ
jgi:hypothetical protein